MTSDRGGPSICAIIAARNEFPYLRVLLPRLAAQGIDVAILDHESTDGSHELYSEFMGKPIILLETLPFRGFFSLTEQLAAKDVLCSRINHDWVIHHDADEIMEHQRPGLTLRDAIREADAAGYNAVNFDEFVFLPEPGSDYSGRDYHAELLRYYFFEPMRNRCNRAWKRSSDLSPLLSGGHRLEGSRLMIAPTNHVLRHYIVLSQDHARRKYVNRAFDELDLAFGWHPNRRNLAESSLLLPQSGDFLFRLEKYDSSEFCRAKPTAKHFWEWA